MTGQIWMYSKPTGTHSKRQQVLRWDFFILIWTACARLVTLLLVVQTGHFLSFKDRGGWSGLHPAPLPPSVTLRYKSYGRSILRILRSFQFWVYLGKLWVFSGILSTFFSDILVYHYPPGQPCLLLRMARMKIDWNFKKLGPFCFLVLIPCLQISPK